MLFGIETISGQALKDQGKGFVKPEEITPAMQKIQSHGIMVMSDFLFGFDAHAQTVFQNTNDFIQDIGFDEVYPHLLIPFPGSRLYENLEKEGRIITKDWSRYDGSHAVYQPLQMTPKALEDGTYWVWRQSRKIQKKNNVHSDGDSSGPTG